MDAKRWNPQPNHPASLDDFLSAARSREEVCSWLGCSNQFLDRAVKTRRLKAYKLSRRFVRFMPNDLREWLEKSAVGKDN